MQKMKSTRTSKKMTTASKRKIFPFLSLPAELRNQIYELALVNPQGHYLVAKRRNKMRTVRAAAHGTHTYNSRHTRHQRLRSHKADLPSRLAYGLFAVNRQINEEACTLVYPKPFVLESSTALHTFLVVIGAKNRGLLTDIGLQDWGGRSRSWNTLFPAFSMMSMGCDNICRLHFTASIWAATFPAKMADEFYREAQPWLLTLIKIKGSKDAALDVIEFTSREDVRNYGSGFRDYYPDYTGDVGEAMKNFKEALKGRLC